MKTSNRWSAFLTVVAALVLASVAHAQRRPYIGYTYPAGGQVATTVQLKLGGQDIDDVDRVLITGSGVSARVVETLRRLNNQEVQLLNEQLRELKRTPAAATNSMAPTMNNDGASMMMMDSGPGKKSPDSAKQPPKPTLISTIERRVREWVQTPACASIASLVIVEVTISPDAEPGQRELRLVSPRGVSNPLGFHVGQLIEYTRKPMTTATIQILGKEAGALRQRPAAEAEVRVSLPCTVNGQIASGEVNRYRFDATKGQRLVFSTQARQLLPYIADAVPGWIQPVLALYDAKGREVAFADDYRFKPDPVILYEIPADGEYVFEIHDSLYRGREDFVYRITAGELPFVTSVFPLGERVGATIPPDLDGVNLRDAQWNAPANNTQPGLQSLIANRMGYRSNGVPFALDELPEVFEQEPNNSAAMAQKVTLPVVTNGRINRADDWDVYQFTGRAKDKVVIDVQARRLDSPLDAVIKLTDATGKNIAFNDDHEDLGAALNTHHADSYLMVTLPTDGIYFVHIGDTARKGGDEYGYRLRIGPPQPDYELRVVPSSISLSTNSTANVTVYAVRKEGFTAPIKLSLKDAPPGFTANAVTITATQAVVQLTLRSGPKPSQGPVKLSVVGTAKVGEREFVRQAVPSEDRMQAFLWRHLVPFSDLQAVIYDRNFQVPPKRVPPVAPSPAPVATTPAAIGSSTAEANKAPSAASTTTSTTPAKPKFSKQQIVGRLRQLKLLYEEGLLTDEFYVARVAECDASQ